MTEHFSHVISTEPSPWQLTKLHHLYDDDDDDGEEEEEEDLLSDSCCVSVCPAEGAVGPLVEGAGALWEV